MRRNLATTGATVARPSAVPQSRRRPPSSSDDLDAKLAGTQELASSIPFNANKALEYDPDAATAPEPGQSVVPHDPIVGASTVTEMNGSEKVGSGGPRSETTRPSVRSTGSASIPRINA